MTGEARVCTGLRAGRLNIYLPAIKKLYSVDCLRQLLVNRVVLEIPICMRHEVLTILLYFQRMTSGAVFRGNHNMDLVAIVFKSIAVFSRVERVALSAADSILS